MMGRRGVVLLRGPKPARNIEGIGAAKHCNCSCLIVEKLQGGWGLLVLSTGSLRWLLQRSFSGSSGLVRCSRYMYHLLYSVLRPLLELTALSSSIIRFVAFLGKVRHFKSKQARGKEFPVNPPQGVAAHRPSQLDHGTNHFHGPQLIRSCLPSNTSY